ncbi:DNA starvation/stationary phase protection protein [Halorubrum sp. CBA1125]|uniref:DNA starvation/stationary phase protection protein DpsA n=1 Tax=Halorubrum sp. CBA1125 TaxID=2668072 RepID=UPI0012E828FC|nr:DNA starvation/stationary phase protection protein DpsA [Halorubrum sp. CBA1125]MUW15374.1 DNA starvation/stationary phase protection protein [Halorubrum sp. CBA1125]
MSTQTQARQRYGDVHESEALRVPEQKAEQLVDALNTDLAATYVLYHQIKKHHWIVEGAEFHDIHEYLGEVAADLEAGADVLAERAQALGGVPLSGGANYEEHAPVSPEDADAYDIRTSLENDLEIFGDIIEQLREHIRLANNLGDYTTEELLREILEDVEVHAHHVEHYLEDDTLVTEGATE